MSENRLSLETSPYLRQHMENPVHWWAWGPEALAEAKRTGKPILLSVGYAACHWCHVMAHESFEDPATAEVMNELYVNIKVDREERPDIDAIYMGALHRLGEQGGWPLTMFLDSDARPFWGGTYFPKAAAYGRPAFVTVLLRIAEAYRNQPDDVASNATRILESLGTRAGADGQAHLSEADIRTLVQRIAKAVDPNHGGLSGAPKFPQWNVLWLLWRGAIRFDDEAAKAAVLTTLANICQGGIYDHLGGGFARYSVDERWLVPHFEKMLYDNALLIDLLTEAWRETQNPLFAARIRETVAWLEREMIAEGGGFASSLDADSEGEEGKFYVWSKAEIVDVLGVSDSEFFCAAYDVTPEGNFEGHAILNRLSGLELLSDADENRLADLRGKLLERRGARIRPGIDDKVLADWNGLMIAALARAACVFDRADWQAMAVRAYDFVSTAMRDGDDRLWHSYRSGQAKAPATASDYANMSWAALRLFQSFNDGRFLCDAERWTATLDRHYWGPSQGGYFTAADDTDDVILRLSSAADDAVPSANTIQLSNLIALAALTGSPHQDRQARDLLAAFVGDVRRNPVGHCGLLAASLDLDALVQIVATAEPVSELCKPLKQLSVPGALEFFLPKQGTASLPKAFEDKVGPDVRDAVRVCLAQLCLQPAVEADAIVATLRHARSSQLKTN